MASYNKLINGLTALGIHKMQEHLELYIDMVNKGQKSFSEALEELVPGRDIQLILSLLKH